MRAPRGTMATAIPRLVAAEGGESAACTLAKNRHDTAKSREDDHNLGNCEKNV